MSGVQGTPAEPASVVGGHVVARRVRRAALVVILCRCGPGLYAAGGRDPVRQDRGADHAGE